MTINSPDDFFANFWDWAFLDQCFHPTKIKVSDGDGIVERNGLFLLLETKSPGVVIPTGQQRMFDALLKTGYFHVLVIWGRRNQPQEMQFWGRRRTPADTASVVNAVRKWFLYADKRG
jgi:hypothetical protein